MKTQYLLTRMKCGRRLGISAAPEENNTYSPFTRFCVYDHHDRDDNKWGSFALDSCVQGVTITQIEGAEYAGFCVISAEDDVSYFSFPTISERIPETGIHTPDSKYFGRMQDIQEIGDSLFACGDGLQFYRRSRYGDGTWHCLAPDLRQPPGTPASAYCIMPRINGPHERAVYAVGQRGSIYFWNGETVRKLDCPVRSTLIDIHVESDDAIWICGGDGTLLKGNHRTGFRLCPGTGLGTTLFQRMTMYDGTLYLAASGGDPFGLFTYRDGRIAPVRTGLQPEIADPHFVDSAHGVLWAMSIKDIVRFDGHAWERIDFPGHPPIR